MGPEHFKGVGVISLRSGFISRADVADFLVKQVNDAKARSQDASADRLSSRASARAIAAPGKHGPDRKSWANYLTERLGQFASFFDG
jgi:hypothetical protein